MEACPNRIKPPYGLVFEKGDLQVYRYPEQVQIKIKTAPEGSVVVGLTDVSAIGELAKAIQP